MCVRERINIMYTHVYICICAMHMCRISFIIVCVRERMYMMDTHVYMYMYTYICAMHMCRTSFIIIIVYERMYMMYTHEHTYMYTYMCAMYMCKTSFIIVCEKENVYDIHTCTYVLCIHVGHPFRIRAFFLLFISVIGIKLRWPALRSNPLSHLTRRLSAFWDVLSPLSASTSWTPSFTSCMFQDLWAQPRNGATSSAGSLGPIHLLFLSWYNLWLTYIPETQEGGCGWQSFNFSKVLLL